MFLADCAVDAGEKDEGGVVLTPSLAGKACIMADADAAVSYWIPALRPVIYFNKPLSEDLLAYTLLKKTGLISYNLTQGPPPPLHTHTQITHNTICCQSLPPGVHV